MAKVGRPSKYTKALGDAICTALANGHSLRSICREGLPGAAMPAMATIFNWLADGKHSDFLEQYTRARERQGEAYADQIGALAQDVLDKPDLDPNRVRVAMDGLKWAAGNLQPKKYADRLKIGPDEDLLRLLMEKADGSHIRPGS